MADPTNLNMRNNCNCRFIGTDDDDKRKPQKKGLCSNATAIAIADMLVEGKTQEEILELCQFITVMHAAVRNYLG